MSNTIRQRFLEKTDDTGRFIVYSSKTGISYFVEPLDGGVKRKFGNVNPATGEIEGESKHTAYGEKYKGSVHPKESLITKENGFENIQLLPAGTSPHGTIEEIDNIRYAEGFRPK